MPIPVPCTEKVKKKKCPELPVLDSYAFPAPPSFWNRFPSYPLPTEPHTEINCAALLHLIHTNGGCFSEPQRHRISVLMDDVSAGVNVPLSENLPGITVPNSISVTAHGETFTDTLAHWVKKKFVAGPFVLPPCADFRVNQMLAIDQHSKVRIVMNLSGPEGESFNDAIIEEALEKVHMSTARLFGYSVVDCGYGARMWKWDMEDAYKNLPAKLCDLRLQGFMWLGRYFLETRQAFGAKSAVAAFDRLGRVIADLALATCNLPRRFLHRTLDDLPIVTPRDSSEGPKFAEAYRMTCEQVGISLAQNCPLLEKAFEDSTVGTVLGIRFCTTDLSWSISPAKYNKILAHIQGPLLGDPVDLLTMQTLLGHLNDLGQMLQFARGFKYHLTKVLKSLSEGPPRLVPLPALAISDLAVWARMLEAARDGLPIPRRTLPPSMAALTFVSDAAGARFARVNGRFIPFGEQGDRGGASINAVEDTEVWFYATVTWPVNLLLHARDSEDHAYGCKSPTLEAIAMILPFLCCPELLLGREVLLLTDNESVVFGWEARRLPNDESASVFIRSLHIISHYLGAHVTVQHLPRMSTASAVLADRLTRQSTTGLAERAAVGNAPVRPIPEDLLTWLRDPFEDWDLPCRLLRAVQKIIESKDIYMP